MALAISGTEPDAIRQAPWGLVLLSNLGFAGALWQFCPTHIWESVFPAACWDWSRKMGEAIVLVAGSELPSFLSRPLYQWSPIA